MTIKEIELKLNVILHKELGSVEIKPTSSLIELGADSLSTMGIITEIEDVFDIDIPNKDIDDILTVEKLINYIEQKVGSNEAK